MADKTTTIVAYVAANHPSGQRAREGFLFTTEPREFEVTADELEAIKADGFIKISKGAKETTAPKTDDKKEAAEKAEADKKAAEEAKKGAK
jgi:hypothetical protein